MKCASALRQNFARWRNVERPLFCSAQRIYRDLVTEVQFTGFYQAV